MNREEFSNYVSMAIEEAIQFAEDKTGQKLPRKFAFLWFDRPESRITENIVEHIVERVFIDEEHMCASVNLGVCDLLDDGSLLVLGSVYDDRLRPFKRNSNGREGPFSPMVGISFLNKMVGVKDSFVPNKPFSSITPEISKHRTPWHVRPDIPRFPDNLQADLSAVIPSDDGEITYWPCAARMKDGSVVQCVYVVAEGPYIRTWGVYPQQDRGKSYISIQDVDALTESPARLPAKLANKLYHAGESGMGYTIFTVVFADGSRQAYGAGNAVDFIHYPEGKSQSDVVDVLPHEGRSTDPITCPECYWCLFSE
jgi:hypothetical protein